MLTPVTVNAMVISSVCLLITKTAKMLVMKTMILNVSTMANFVHPISTEKRGFAAENAFTFTKKDKLINTYLESLKY